MAVIRINYIEPDTKTYESVRISYGDNKVKIFNSGNFVKDWYDMRKFMIMELSETEFHFSHSSSVDHFIMDGAPFNSAYLKFKDDGAPYFAYEYDWNDSGIEFFVEEGTQPTWEELKERFK